MTFTRRPHPSHPPLWNNSVPCRTVPYLLYLMYPPEFIASWSWSGSSISNESGSVSRVLMTKNWRQKCSWKFSLLFLIKKIAIYLSLGQPSALKREHSVLQKTFFLFLSVIFLSWIRIWIAKIWIQIRIPGTPFESGSNPGPNPQHWYPHT